MLPKVPVAVTLLVFSFFAYHQTANTGFFTSAFRAPEMIFFYGPIVLSIAAPLTRAVIGCRNPARPLEVVTNLFSAVAAVWLLTVFPFDFLHLADALPTSLLIVDEHTAGLDLEECIRFRNLLAEAAGDRTVLLSTHIVEDVAQTCRDMAILTEGRVVFHGTVSDLLRQAQEHVWNLTSAASGPRPEGDFTIVSMHQAGDPTHYHIVGTPVPSTGTIPAEPTLEDGYVWLMRGRHEGHAMAAR